jgi:DNA repair protein RadA/Sms
MAKAQTRFSCQSCGATYPRWVGKCEACGEWNTVVEEVITGSQLSAKSVKAAKAQDTQRLDTNFADEPRLSLGSAELDRVLGGGLVKDAAILIGGDPGIGKSTLLLQATAYAATAGHKVLYFSGEESPSQIQSRARRMGLDKSPVHLVATSSLETILATLGTTQPALTIIDSIQTVFSEKLDAAPGTVSQVRLTAHEVIQHCKRVGSAVIFVGHVTKDGQIAGPRIIEHMVDTVLYFEGERGHSFRVLRAFKNRFGATNEIGVFDMTGEGLKDVANPSALFLAERPQNAAGSVILAAVEGTRPVLVEVQALVSQSALAQPRRTCLGLDPNRVAMIAAILDKHAGFTFGAHDIFLNVTGGLKVTEPAADLAIAAALLSSLLNRPVAMDKVVFGELGLTGEVRSVPQQEARLKEAAKLGFNQAVMPQHKGGKAPLSTLTVGRLDDLVQQVF